MPPLKLAAVPQAENSELFHVLYVPKDPGNVALQEANNVSAHKLIISGSPKNVVFLHVTYAS